MNKSLSLLTACLITAAAAAAENPACALFPSDIKFYLSFNDGSVEPDMATGDAKPTLIQGPAKFTDGICGKALSLGRAFFKAPQNIDLKTPGSVIFWVAPENWPQKAEKDPGFTGFSAWTLKHNAALIVGKSFNQPWGKSSLNAYMQTPQKTVSCPLQFKGNAKDWKNGQWHMLAVTWKPAGFSYSVDGEKSKFAYLKTPLTADSEGFYVGISGKKETCAVLLDEFVILGKALSDEEIAKLYAESIKAFAVK